MHSKAPGNFFPKDNKCYHLENCFPLVEKGFRVFFNNLGPPVNRMNKEVLSCPEPGACGGIRPVIQSHSLRVPGGQAGPFLPG